MSMMNANAAATTTMTANEPLDFELPEIGEAEFSNEELAEDMDGLTMSFPRIKIPAGGVLQFEIPNGDPQHPDYRPTLTGVILYNHASCAYWPEGDEYNDDVPPLCSSVDGKQGYGEPGGTCATCTLSQFGSASNGRGKACKNMRVLYLLRSGEFMPLAINLSPTSISPFREFLNQGFVFRNRATYGSLVEIGLKRQTNPEGKDYSVATFKRLGDFHGDQLAAVRKYALSFREQIRGMNRQRIEAKREQDPLRHRCVTAICPATELLPMPPMRFTRRATFPRRIIKVRSGTQTATLSPPLPLPKMDRWTKSGSAPREPLQPTIF